jgi:hypothetical protein
MTIGSTADFTDDLETSEDMSFNLFAHNNVIIAIIYLKIALIIISFLICINNNLMLNNLSKNLSYCNIWEAYNHLCRNNKEVEIAMELNC